MTPLTFEWGRRTHVMGVVNVTPDSFSGDGITDVQAAVALGRQMRADGADIIDVGGESTRPGAHPVPLDEELRRVMPVIEVLAADRGAVVSVDTMKSEVAQRALGAGAVMINDVSAMRSDPEMAGVVAEFQAPVVLMHGYGTAPAADAPVHGIVSEVLEFLEERIESATAAGVARERILIDPGFGFAKTVQQNLEILRRLRELRVLKLPVVIGPSRKGTIGRVLGGLPVEERVEGTAAAVVVSIINGADVVRVHDVRVMTRVARMTDAIIRPELGE